MIKEKVLKEILGDIEKKADEHQLKECGDPTECHVNLWCYDLSLNIEKAIDLAFTEAEKEFKKDLLSAYAEGHENGEKEKLEEVGRVNEKFIKKLKEILKEEEPYKGDHNHLLDEIDKLTKENKQKLGIK